MLKFILIFLLSFLLIYFIGPFFHFWVMMIGVAFIAFLVGGPSGTSFLAGALAFGLAWLIISLLISINSGSDLPDKMGALLGFSNYNFLWVMTAVLGFVIGGFSALTGSLFRKLFTKRDQGIYRG